VPSDWTPKDYAVMMTVGTACLCLLILVLGAVIGVMNHAISPEALGTIQGAGVGGGLLGLGIILYWIIKTALGGSSGDHH